MANDNGRRCLQLCATHGLLVANTFFKHKDEHTASWVSNTGTHWAMLDLILVSKRFQSSVRDTRVLPAATAHDSDHRLVVCDLRLRLKATRAQVKAKAGFNADALKPDSPALAAYQGAIGAALAALPSALDSSEAECQAMTQALTAAAEAHAGRTPRQPRGKEWITPPTRQLCQQKRAAFLLLRGLLSAPSPATAPSPLEHMLLLGHRAAISSANAEYRRLNRLARAAARQDKNAALLAKAKEMDELMLANRTQEAYRIAAELRGCGTRGKQVQAVRAAPGAPLSTGAQVAQTLAQHFHSTLNVESPVAAERLAEIPPGPQQPATPPTAVAAAALASPLNPPQGTQAPAPPRPFTRATATAATAQRQAATAAASDQLAAMAADEGDPTLSEVQAAIKKLRNTAPGADGLNSFLIQKGEVAAAHLLHRVILAAWRTGTAPQEWKSALMVPIHKKGSTLDPDNFRPISLSPVAGKVYVTVIHQRIRGLLNSQLLDSQNGFRPGRGTSEALFSMRKLQELARDFQSPVHAAFVDFRKAFDSVNRDVLWQLLLARGVAPKLVDLIKDLYSGCEARVSANGSTSDPFPMATGVRQGCPMSPTLFNVFMDFLARLVTQRCKDAGVQGYKVASRISGRLLAPPSPADLSTAMLLLLYADDLVLLADSAADLNTALRVLEATATEWGMQLNYSKTKVVVFGCEGQLQAATSLAQGEVAHTDHFPYLGCTLEVSAQQGRELDKRLHQAGVAFYQLQKGVFAPRGVTLATKMRLYKTVVLPMLLYGAAVSWALTAAQLQRLDVFNTTCLRRILNVRRLPGPGMLSNKRLYEITKQPAISDLLMQLRLKWLGHAGRMDPERLVHQLLFATAPVGEGLGVQRRARGRPLATWAGGALADMRTLNRENTWFKDCQGRELWKRIVSSCTTVGLTANGM